MAAARTLVVYDRNPLVARGLASLLEAEAPHLQAVCAPGPLDQFEEFTRSSSPDLLLVDMISGHEILRRSAISQRTHVVVIGAGEDDQEVISALKLGVCAYLDNDLEITDIVATLDLVLRNHVVLPARLMLACLGEDRANLRALSDTEVEILSAIAQGETNREIAARIHVSERTVRRHILHLYSKLHVGNRLDAALYAVRMGLGTPAGR